MRFILIATLVCLTTSLSLWFLYQDQEIEPIPNHSSRNPQVEDPLPVADTATAIGQHFMIGHWANTPVASTTNLIREYGVGGVIIMSVPDEPTEILEWTKEWQSVSSTTLLIAIDQEGGPVSRLRGPDFITTGQAEIMDVGTARQVGLARGQELARLGINLNFAPVLDTAINPESFMYERVFRDQNLSPVLANAMIVGMAEAGVAGVVKHFPGHDDTADDSHLILPKVSYRDAALEDFLSPFVTLLTNYPPAALMTAHVAFPLVDPLPATLSPYWLTTRLREELSFQGVVFTDDMIMDAIDQTWAHEEATVMALAAGADIILYAAEPVKVKTAINAVREAVINGQLTEDQVSASRNRILTLQSQIQ
jgi:beta-N-acetylhexosaminidase